MSCERPQLSVFVEAGNPFEQRAKYRGSSRIHSTQDHFSYTGVPVDK
jgi:hypothetical protein